MRDSSSLSSPHSPSSHPELPQQASPAQPQHRSLLFQVHFSFGLKVVQAVGTPSLHHALDGHILLPPASSLPFPPGSSHMPARLPQASLLPSCLPSSAHAPASSAVGVEYSTHSPSFFFLSHRQRHIFFPGQAGRLFSQAFFYSPAPTPMPH